jgi:hypothetical protein
MTEDFPDGGPADTESLWMAGQVLSLADGQAAQIAREAADHAAALREAAEREAAAITQQAAGHAAAIREAAELEAAQLRSRLDSISGELGRVAAYVTNTLAAPAMPGTAPAPAASPDLPGLPGPGVDLRANPVRPAVGPPAPGTRPDWPVRPDTARPPTGPRTKPSGPAPGGKPQKQNRQHHAMRIATYATAALLLFSVICGAAEVGLHGFQFFVFREGGVGQTPGTETDQQFLAREAAARHVVTPKGHHLRKPHEDVKAHHK